MLIYDITNNNILLNVSLIKPFELLEIITFGINHHPQITIYI